MNARPVAPTSTDRSHSAPSSPDVGGDEAEFRRLFDAAYDDLLRFVERRVHPITAEDVVADVFLVAWRRLEEVPAPLDEARAWLFGVAQRTLANQRRGDARRLSLVVRVGQVDLTPAYSEDHGPEVAARTDLARAWSRLGPTDQEVLTMTALDGLTGTQAASVLGVSPTAFRVRLVRARRRLRLHMRAPAPTSDR